ncbi:hypothetical protein ZWY2020_025566, partial [Hordeum vulgare]
HFHYEDVLRHDPLLKLNHANISTKSCLDFRIQFGKLAMEILCVEIHTQRPLFSSRKVFDPIHSWGPKDTGYVADFARQSASPRAWNVPFLVRILTVMSMLDSPIFEHIRGFNVTIVTLANTEDETYYRGAAL